MIVKFREKQTKKRIEGERKSKELEEARNLQNSLLPKINPEVDGYQISTFLKSATEIGGDYYDFFYEKGKYFYAICGDATGHGVISGIMVSVTKAGLSGIPLSSPSKILEQLNEWYGITHIFSLVDRHESNGAVRVIHEVTRHLSALVNDKRVVTSWAQPEYISSVRLLCNSTPLSERGGYSAHDLQFGTHDQPYFTYGYVKNKKSWSGICLLYTSPSPRDLSTSRMPSSA